MKDYPEILSDDVKDRLKISLGVKTDKELALILGLSPPSVSGWKKQNTIPYKECAKVALEKGISLDWFIFGKGPDPVAPEKLKAVAWNALPMDEQMLLTGWRALSKSKQDEFFGQLYKLSRGDSAQQKENQADSYGPVTAEQVIQGGASISTFNFKTKK